MNAKRTATDKQGQSTPVLCPIERLVNAEIDRPSIILVVEDVEETRDGIEKLLTTDGYCVDPVRDEAQAIVRARNRCPDLILVSLGGQSAQQVIAAAQRIRVVADLSEEIPIVIFCVDVLEQGVELEIARNVYVTRPDNFNQLRSLLGRLLHQYRSIC